MSEHFLRCIHLADNKLLKKCKKKACQGSCVVFLGRGDCDDGRGGEGRGPELKVTPRFEMPQSFVMIMRGGLWKSVTVKRVWWPCHCGAPSAPENGALEHMIGSRDQMEIPSSV